MAKKSRRKRVSREDVRRKARESNSGQNWFILPADVRQFAPEKSGKFEMDILPYEVTSKHHPDEITPKELWYQYLFRVHHKVGPDEKSLVCPTSINKPCPICEEVKELKQKYKENEDTIKAIQGQQYMMYNIIDPDDPDKVALFVFSIGKFANLLEEEVADADEEDLDFYHAEGGKMLRVRFSDKSHEGFSFIKATKIDFKPRDDMDEEEILEKTVNLDECLKIIDYNKLNGLFLHLDEDGNEEGAGTEEGDPEEEEKPTRRRHAAKPKEKEEPEPVAVEDPDPEDFDEDFDEDPPAEEPEDQTEPGVEDEVIDDEDFDEDPPADDGPTEEDPAPEENTDEDFDEILEGISL